jgi:hypothetical protein
VSKRLVAVVATVLCGLTLACAGKPTEDPNPQPDHGAKPSYSACPRDNSETVCVEFYSSERVTIHIRVTGLNGKGENAPLIDRHLEIYPGGGAAGFGLPLTYPPVAIGGRAAFPPGISVGCRVLVRGLEIPDAGDKNKTGTVVCLFTTS